MISGNVKWDTYVKVMTLFVIMSCTLGCAIILFCTDSIWDKIGLVIIVVSIVSVFFLAPRRLVLGKSGLVLYKMIGTLNVDLDEITDLGIYEKKTELNLRLCGSGGFLGYLGIFRNKTLGKYMAYVGDYSQAFWVRTKKGKCYMFSCENRDLLLSAIRKEMHNS